MKHHELSVQTLGNKNMPKVLYIALITAIALFMTNGLAQAFNGFASYQDYLNNYYAQNQVQNQQSRTTTFTPAVQVLQTTPFDNTNSYNGFASYQDYLNNYYANQNARSTSVVPCGYQGLLTLFVHGNNNCIPNTSTPRTFTTPYTNTAPFNGYPSYQAYLDAFYAGTASPRTLNNVNNALNDYYRYSSYDEFIRATYGNNNTVGPRSGIIQTLPPTPSTSLNGFFEFSVGQTYQFNNGLILTVQTLNDNRCPLNIACIWQGDIAATVRLEMGNDIRTITVSMVEGAEAPQVVVNNTSIQFVGLGQNTNTLNTYVSMN